MSKFDIVPEFIQGSKGKLYTNHYKPEQINEDTECILIVPAFAEEMNRCRYMCTMFAQQVSSSGLGCFILDPYGTGDSEGDFADTNWEQVCLDLVTAADYISNQGYKRISVLAIRLGALQLFDITEKISNLHRILLWQPITNGQVALTQFLRIRMAASLSRNEAPESMKDFEKIIAKDMHIEVAGYDLSPAFYESIKTSKLDKHISFNKVPIAWFTTIASAERKAPKVEINLIEQWREQGADINYFVIIAPPYWQVHERTLAPQLVDSTVNYILGKSK